MLIGLALGFEVPHVQISYYTFLNSDMLNPVYSFLFSLFSVEVHDVLI